MTEPWIDICSENRIVNVDVDSEYGEEVVDRAIDAFIKRIEDGTEAKVYDRNVKAGRELFKQEIKRMPND